MKRLLIPALTLACSVMTAAADEIRTRLADDAKVIRRIAEVSRRDFPEDVVKRIIDDDLQTARGRRADGTFAYAHYERDEASRADDRFGVRAKDEKRPEAITFVAENVYRVIVSVPSRRLLVARNRRVYVDRVDLEYTPFGGSTQTRSFAVDTWLDTGEQKSIDVPEISRRVKATVRARVDRQEAGPATLEIAMLQPRLIDNTDSPYYAAVQTLKSLERAVERREIAQIRTLSNELLARTGGETMMVTAPRSEAPRAIVPTHTAEPSRRSELEAMPQVEIYLELQAVEDLLTGSEAERREGLDRLHQLIRKLRNR